MSQNVIQFQHGLSWAQFHDCYGSEAQCEAAVVAARWPRGWRCAHCGCKRFFHTRNGHGRLLWECFVCGYQSSSIAGTVMEHTKVPLTKWFQAMYLLTQNKNTLSALALSRQIGVSYRTAWLLKHKLMQTMLLREESRPLQGRVEIDDAYLGGEREGHINGGRKAANKTAFVAAIQTSDDGHPLRMRLTPVVDFTNADMARWAQGHLAPGCHVVSDGTWAFAQVVQAGATHERHVTGGGRQGARTPQLRWVNTLLGNLKTSLTGRGCAEFCVNGQSNADASRPVRKHHEYQETRRTRRTAVWPAGQLQEARRPDWRERTAQAVDQAAGRASFGR